MSGSSGPRMTLSTRLVLQVLMEDPAREWYGLELSGAAGLATGTIHPILARLERVGWLVSHWEQVDPRTEGRPRRRYYRLDPNSLAVVGAAVRRAEAAAPALSRLRPRATGSEA